MSPRPSRIRLVPRLVLLAACVYAFFWVSGFPRTYDDDELPPSEVETQAPAPHIESEKLVVTVKTSAVDAFAKIPPLLLLTNGKYHDNLLLLGDLHLDVGAFHVHDVLDRYDAKYVSSTPDLERYRRLTHYARNSLDFGRLRETDPAKEKAAKDKMEKYMMLRMLQRTWEQRPDRKWYVFVEPDTYLFRSNIQVWLAYFDHEEPHFFYNPPETDPYGIGGSTFILSQKAMQGLFVENDKDISGLEAHIEGKSSGTEVLTGVMSNELDLSPNGSWPGVSSFNPDTIPFGHGMWCEVVMALHSVSAESMSNLWRLERERNDKNIVDPLTFSDIWMKFLQPENLNDVRDDWDNLSSGKEFSMWNILFDGVDHDSRHHHHHGAQGRAPRGEDNWKACQDACNDYDQCMQWSYSSIPQPNANENGDTKCHLSSSLRFGAHADPREVTRDGTKVQKTWKSGWRKDRFEAWAKQQNCKA
ncbi:hypothetical protein BS50DRAFT_578174 [Corynespora cassiicola Philippines]|uniref:Glycosyltransferase family 31 protein n=1 Tax=Corynespora cassiicola Philippines TaxID=1448308 RepID=A0A2T2N8C1_CORCC|nr:hypothetical protein BS50DRAFT_578174 [Corynespora cassiicola Philippines]